MSIDSRKNLVGLLLLVPLGVAFALVCLLLMVKKNNPGLIKKKLRIGALLLTFTTFATFAPRASASCYEVEADMIIWPVDSEINDLGIAAYDGVSVTSAWNIIISEGTAKRVLFAFDTTVSSYTDLGYQVVSKKSGAPDTDVIMEGELESVSIDSDDGLRYFQIDVPAGTATAAEYFLRITGLPYANAMEREMITEINVNLINSGNKPGA